MYHLSAIFYFILQSYRQYTQSRIHRPKIINNFFIYLLFHFLLDPEHCIVYNIWYLRAAGEGEPLVLVLEYPGEECQVLHWAPLVRGPDDGESLLHPRVGYRLHKTVRNKIFTILTSKKIILRVKSLCLDKLTWSYFDDVLQCEVGTVRIASYWIPSIRHSRNSFSTFTRYCTGTGTYRYLICNLACA